MTRVVSFLVLVHRKQKEESCRLAPDFEDLIVNEVYASFLLYSGTVKSFEEGAGLNFYFCFVMGPYPAVHRAYFWLCAQGVTPGGLRRPCCAGNQNWISQVQGKHPTLPYLSLGNSLFQSIMHELDCLEGLALLAILILLNSPDKEFCCDRVEVRQCKPN